MEYLGRIEGVRNIKTEILMEKIKQSGRYRSDERLSGSFGYYQAVSKWPWYCCGMSVE